MDHKLKTDHGNDGQNKESAVRAVWDGLRRQCCINSQYVFRNCWGCLMGQKWCTRCFWAISDPEHGALHDDCRSHQRENILKKRVQWVMFKHQFHRRLMRTRGPEVKSNCLLESNIWSADTHSVARVMVALSPVFTSWMFYLFFYLKKHWHKS